MPAPTTTVVASVEKLRVFLSSISHRSTLYLDLEGRNLSRNGTFDILTALVRPTKKTSLIDVHTLADTAFTTANGADRTLKGILGDPDVPKYFWGVRNDADALWSHHRVRLAGVTDVQLLENATRRANKTRLWGLNMAVKRHLKPRQEDRPVLRQRREVAAWATRTLHQAHQQPVAAEGVRRERQACRRGLRPGLPAASENKKLTLIVGVWHV
ncbi:hypothetical protein RB600_001595 [Gaeumannomyces tritici]